MPLLRIQHVLERREVERMTVDADLLRGVAAEGVVVDPRVHVVDHEEIDVVVTIDVDERAARAEDRSAGDTSARGHVGEALTAVVVIEPVRSHARHVQIGPAIVVVVGGASAHAVPGVHDTRGCGDILERSVAAVSIQAIACRRVNLRIDERSSVDQEEVHPAVLVVVEEEPAAAHDLEQMTLGRAAVDVAEIHARCRRDVRELRRCVW